MEHLSLEIFDETGVHSQYAALPDNTSITITDTSEIFASGDVWSYSFTLNVAANAHIFGTAGDMHGSRLHDQIHKRRARLWVEGLPMYLGYLKLGDEAEVDEEGNVDVTFESGQKTFEDLIEGAKANQVPLMSDVQIGVALWRKRWARYRVKLSAWLVFDDSDRGEIPSHHDPVTDGYGHDVMEFETDGEAMDGGIQSYPRMVFPRGEFTNMTTGLVDRLDFVNTDHPYDDEHPYCNTTLCYQRYGYGYGDAYSQENVVKDYNSEPVADRGYEVMPADRVNSAPNFFVIYWIKALMKHLGIHIDENQMEQVEDLRRLFMVNTACEYRVPKNRTDYGGTVGWYRFVGYGRERYRLVPEMFGPFEDGVWQNPRRLVDAEKCGFSGTITRIDDRDCRFKVGDFYPIKFLKCSVTEVQGWGSTDKNTYMDRNSYLHDAFATSDCFPDVDVSDVIKAVESGFGVRLLFSEDFKRVRIILIRNIFRNTDVQDVACDVIGRDVKMENHTRGFRMTYGENTDTHFYYKGFADLLPHKKEIWKDNSDTHDYSKWDLNAEYSDVINRVTAFNKTCYVTPVNGNAYGIKVDKDAKTYRDLHPSLFEYAGFMDAEDGDCSGEEETIETVTVNFTPAIQNDLNMEQERAGRQEQQFALFVDEQMRPRRPDLLDGRDYNDPTVGYDVDGELYGRDQDGNYKHPGMRDDDGIIKPGEFAITSDMYVKKTGLKADIIPTRIFDYGPWHVYFDLEGYINEGYRLYLQDNYAPNDDGVPPVETHDWGLTFGIMRGSGSDAGVAYDADPDDREGNDTWERVAGSGVTAHPDTCDNYGNLWDYNGSEAGIGPTDRISLKLRAEKLNPYFDASQPEGDGNRRYLDIESESLRRRGLCDQFYQEYSYWVRNARIAKRTVRMEFAQLMAIDKTKRVRVGDIMGFIRKMQYTVSTETGLGLVTMESMYI